MWYSMGYLNAYILSVILVYSAFFAGFASGIRSNDIATAKKIFVQNPPVTVHNRTAIFLEIFFNNLRITFIGFIPIMGNAYMLDSIYASAYVVGLYCLASHGLTPYYTRLPFIIAETTASIIMLAESIIFLSYLVFKKLKIRLKPIILATIILLISAYIEAYIITI